VARIDDFVPGVDVVLVAARHDDRISPIRARAGDPRLRRPVNQGLAECPSILEGHSGRHVRNLTEVAVFHEHPPR